MEEEASRHLESCNIGITVRLGDGTNPRYLFEPTGDIPDSYRRVKNPDYVPRKQQDRLHSDSENDTQLPPRVPRVAQELDSSYVPVDFWYAGATRLHQKPEQMKRQRSAANIVVESRFVDRIEMVARIKDYAVSLESCSCVDFARRHLPCKHMYRLAHELGVYHLGF